MSPAPVVTEQPPIIGSDENDYITVEDSISFQWIPDPGNSYSGSASGTDWNTVSW